jgi:hypothetical protein
MAFPPWHVGGGQGKNHTPTSALDIHFADVVEGNRTIILLF